MTTQMKFVFAIAVAGMIAAALLLSNWSPWTAEAATTSTMLDISEMHQNIKDDLPVADYNDMTFVFSHGD
jgi:hypothetical protein